MIPVCDPGHREIGREGIPVHLLLTSKRVALTLQNQQGGVQTLQMLGSQLIRLSGRVKRVPETDPAHHRMRSRHAIEKLTGDTASHRLSSDDQRLTINEGLDLLAEALFEHRHAIRCGFLAGCPRSLHVGKLETDHTPAPIGQADRNGFHEGAVHTCPGTVRQEKRQGRIVWTVL